MKQAENKAIADKHMAALDKTIRDAVSKMHRPVASHAGIAQAQVEYALRQIRAAKPNS